MLLDEDYVAIPLMLERIVRDAAQVLISLAVARYDATASSTCTPGAMTKLWASTRFSPWGWCGRPKQAIRHRMTTGLSWHAGSTSKAYRVRERHQALADFSSRLVGDQAYHDLQAAGVLGPIIR